MVTYRRGSLAAGTATASLARVGPALAGPRLASAGGWELLAATRTGSGVTYGLVQDSVTRGIYRLDGGPDGALILADLVQSPKFPDGFFPDSLVAFDESVLVLGSRSEFVRMVAVAPGLDSLGPADEEAALTSSPWDLIEYERREAEYRRVPSVVDIDEGEWELPTPGPGVFASAIGAARSGGVVSVMLASCGRSYEASFANQIQVIERPDRVAGGRADWRTTVESDELGESGPHFVARSESGAAVLVTSQSNDVTLVSADADPVFLSSGAAGALLVARPDGRFLAAVETQDDVSWFDQAGMRERGQRRASPGNRLIGVADSSGAHEMVLGDPVDGYRINSLDMEG